MVAPLSLFRSRGARDSMDRASHPILPSPYHKAINWGDESTVKKEGHSSVFFLNPVKLAPWVVFLTLQGGAQGKF